MLVKSIDVSVNSDPLTRHETVHISKFGYSKVYFLEASDLKFKSVNVSHMHFFFTNKPPRGVEIQSIRVNEVIFKSISSRMIFKTYDVRLSHVT